MELSGEMFGGRFWFNLLRGELNRLEIDFKKLYLLDKGEMLVVALPIFPPRRLPVYEASSFFRLQESFHSLNLQVLRKFCTIRMCVKLWPFSSPKFRKFMGASPLLCIFRESGIKNYFLCPSFLVTMIVKIKSNVFHSKYILYDSWGLWCKRCTSI